MYVQLTQGAYFLVKSLHSLFHGPKSNLTLCIGTGVVDGLSGNIGIINGRYRLVKILLHGGVVGGLIFQSLLGGTNAGSLIKGRI